MRYRAACPGASEPFRMSRPDRTDACRPFRRRGFAFFAAAAAAAAATAVASAAAVAPAAAAAPADPEAIWNASGPWLTFRGEDGPGAGRRIVFVSGDEEYRSEEALPQLAAILAERHGFTCRVVFAIDPETGRINPDVRTNIPGLEALAAADLMVIATRFRDLPDEQMRHVDAFVQSGKPIVGLRTATHAFAMRGDSAYAGYSWNHDGERWPQGFGRAILGETWIAHHGAHGSEATRGRIPPEAADDAILRGIADGGVFGDTDVYRVRLPLPEGCRTVMLGEVVAGMSQSDPPKAGEQNDPMMPLAWTRTMPLEAGGVRRVFTTTLGAATDFVVADSRRLFLHGVMWAMGLEDRIPDDGLDASPVGPYDPTAYGFGGFVRDVRPADLPGGSAAAGPAGAAVPPPARLELPDGGTILLVGGTMAERIAQSGALAALAHAAHPGRGIRVREVPWSGDEIARRPREVNVPGVRDWILATEADAVIACFGMSESFNGEAGLEAFAADTQSFIDMVRQARGPAVDITLVSPLLQEDLGTPWPTGAALADRHRDIAAYSAVLAEAAAANGVRFIDLAAEGGPVAAAAATAAEPLTVNGIHPGPRGAVVVAGGIAAGLGWIDAAAAAADAAAGGNAATGMPLIQRIAVDAHHFWRQRYRPTNTEYVWGRRHRPFGNVNFPAELEQLERMVAARDTRLSEEAAAFTAADTPAGLLATMIAAAAADERADRATPWEIAPTAGRLPADDWTPEPVVARGTETSLGSTEIASPRTFIDEAFTVAAGYVVECFASEEDFPELANPLACAFDGRGRLWVLCAPTYPHLLPGSAPESRVIVLEDRDGDGRADACSVFADGLMTPTGIALDGGDVYIGEAPDLLRLRDTDGDGVADRREIVASGFGMPDSHHQISALEWAPDGGLLLHEGVFTISAVETPWGLARTRDAAVWRFCPRTGRLTVLSHSGFSNPWGHAFDDFGQSVLADASGGDNVAFSQVIGAYTWPHKPGRPGAFLNRGRPTAGCELIASRHFPEDRQDTFLVNQSIGFHGTRWDRVITEPDVSGLRAERLPEDILASSDVNFRPVGMEIGPDGTLYIVDWCNPIIGHMQYSVRDPRRDATHGRIWRVRHAQRPLVDAPDVDAAAVASLLEMLRLPERNTRQIARRRLQSGDPAAVLPAVDRWLGEIAARHAMAADPLHDRLTLEALWIHEAHGVHRADLLDRVLGLLEPRARAAAVRVIRLRLQDGSIEPAAAAERLERAIADPDMRVRLEATVAAGFLPPVRGESIAVRAADRPMDGPMFTVLEATLEELERRRIAAGGGGDASGLVRRLQLLRAPAEQLLEVPLDPLVASVRLARADLDVAAREVALDLLAGGDGTRADEPARAAVLLVELESARLDATISAVGELLLQRSPVALAGEAVRDRRRRLESDPRPVMRAAAVAAGLRAGDERLVDAAPGADLAAAVLRTPAGADGGETLAAAVARLRRDVVLGLAPVDPGLAAVMRHAAMLEGGRPAAVAWLERLVDRGGRRPLDAWGPSHELAMAALGQMRAIDPSERPAWLDPAVLAMAAADRLDRGRAIYHDEAVGCIRCHGADGRGLEGYPPLAESPWMLGDPRIAAGIVVHGLYGPVRMPDGRRFDSVMAPLGENLSDEQIADVLTWVRQAWGNVATPVDAAMVADARGTTPPGGTMWTVASLEERWPLRRASLLGPLAEPVATAEAVAGPGGPAADAPASASPSSRSVRPVRDLGLLTLALAAGLVVVGVLAERSRRAA